MLQLQLTFQRVFLVFGLIFYIRIKQIHIETWPGWSLECFADWRLYLSLAVPGFFMMVCEWSAWEIAIVMSSTLGTIYIDVLSISEQFLFMFYLIPLGICAAGNIHAGHFIGANKPAEAKNVTKVFFTVAVLATAIGSFIMFIFSGYLPMAFGNDQNLIQMASQTLKLLALVYFLDGIACAFKSMMRLLGAQFYGSIMGVLSWYLIGVPIGIWLMLKTSLGLFGWFIGLIACIGLIILTNGVFIFRTDWIKYAEKVHNRSETELPVTDEINSENFKSNIKYVLHLKCLIYIIMMGLLLTSIFLNSKTHGLEMMTNSNITTLRNESLDTSLD